MTLFIKECSHTEIACIESHDAKKITLHDVLTDICFATDTKEKDVLGKSRKKEFVMVRIIICFIARKKYGNTLNGIAELIGRDHTTVIHSIHSFEDLYFTKEVFFMKYLNMVIENSKYFTAKDFQ